MNIKKMLRKAINLPTETRNRLIFTIKGVKYPKNGAVKGKINLVNRGNILFGDGCIVNGKNKYNPIGCGDGCTIVTENGAVITIGKNVGMSNCALYSRESITIGDNVLLGGGVKIYDTDFHSIEAKYRGTPEDKQHTKNNPVVIDDGAFIGAGTIVLKGVHIGKEAVIGAGSVLTKDVPEGEIWAGNPAKKIR